MTKLPSLHAPVLCALAVSTAGCQGFFFSRTGEIMSAYTEQHVVPYLMEQPDVGLACRVGGGLGTFVASFERVSDRPDLAALVASLGAGMCAELVAREADLAYERAVRAGGAAPAKDAQLRGQRAHLLAARRYLAAWKRAENHWGRLGGKCPEIEPEDELFFTLGLASGLLAALHDRDSGGAAKVPMEIPREVERATTCVDNARWWGVPRALAAAVWMTIPGSVPKGTVPEKVLERAAAIGDRAGVGLARAMQVVALAAKGDDKGLAAAIAAHAKARERRPAAADYRLLDSYAAGLTRFYADLIWTRETGHRGPTGELGRLPDKAPAEGEDDDLIEGLEDDG